MRERDTPNPHMMSIARDLRGMTHEHLSAATGIPAERLRAAEQYKRFYAAEPDTVLTEPELEALAAVLSVPVDFFFRNGERYSMSSWSSVCTRSGARHKR